MDELFKTIEEQAEQLTHIQRIAYNEGWKAGYKVKEQEIEDKRDKEMEEMYQDSLRQEELAQERDEELRAGIQNDMVEENRPEEVE